MPQLIMHGGNCCGVTHLYLADLSGPDEECENPLKKFDWNELRGTAKYQAGYRPVKDGETPAWKGQTYTSEPNYNTYAYQEDRPNREPAGVRVDAILKGMIKSRPGGFIDAVTVEDEQDEWEEWLEARGFKAVGRTENSNSNNTLIFWLLDTNAWRKKQKEEAAKKKIEAAKKVEAS